MKNITKFINESVKPSWANYLKHIKYEDLIKYATQALKKSKTFASDILDELGQYKDPDDLDAAYERGNLDYCKWEEELLNMLADDNKYGGDEGNIGDEIWANAYDLFNELYKQTSK